MALLKFKRSAVPAKVPSIADLDLGELAINTYDGKVYTKKDDGTQSIVEVGGSSTTLGTMATQNADAVAITGGTITGVTMDSISNHVGADHIHYKVKATQILAKGDVVKVFGFNAGEDAFEVAKVSASTDIAVGVIYSPLASGEFGSIINTGLLEGIDTSAYAIGTTLYPNTTGGFTSTKPTTGRYQALAFVVRSHANLGTILIEASEPQPTSLSQFTNDSGYITSSALTPYALKTGAAFTGAISSTTSVTAPVISTAASGIGSVYLNAGTASNTGYISFWNAAAVRQSYIGYSTANNNLTFQAEGSTGFSFNKTVAVTGSVTASVDMRAPIFYDSDNTAYYVNAATTSAIYSVTFIGNTYWQVSLTDAAIQRADARDDATNFSRLHWYGMSDVGATSNFRHAWYDGNDYINVTAGTGGRIDFSGSATSMHIGANRIYADNYHPEADKWTTARTLSLSGDATGSVSWDGSANVTLSTTVVNDSHEHSFNSLINKTGGTGTYTTSGDFRAPIFYDSNNTVYYVDPTGGTSLTSVYADQYFQRGSGTPTSNLGNPTVTEMALFDRQFNNKTAFYPDANLKFFTSTDGVTWTEYTSFTVAQKKAFLGGDATSGVFIPNATPYFRIEITNNGSYVYLNALYMYWSASGNSSTIKIQKRRASDDVWLQHTNSSTAVAGWPSHVYLPFATIPYISPTSTSASHFDTINIDFQPTWANANNIALYNMEVWGGYPAGSRNIYTTDYDKNVTFPSVLSANTDVRAPTFYDSNNTGFYFDGAGTSNLNAATFSGNVGIGTSATAAKLHINESSGTQGRYGTRITQSGWTSVYGELVLDTTNTKVDLNTSNGLYPLSFSIAGTEAMRIDANRNVVVATTTAIYPSANRGNLTIGGSSSSLLFLGTGGTTGTYLNHNQSTSGAELWNGANGPMQFATNNIERMRIDAIGNVGVGTSSPDYKLSVAGTSLRVGIVDSSAAEPWSNTDLGGFVFRTHYGLQERTGMYAVGNFATGGYQPDLVFKTSATERLRINYAGNVTASVDVRAPIFYDSNNTAFYVDPASTSNLSALNVNGSAVYRSDWTTRFQSGSDFVDGTLVTTDIPATATNGDSFVIEITGKSYDGSNPPFKVIAQGYIYNNTIINYSGISYAGNFASYIKVFQDGGVLKFWWPRISYWNSFNVNVMAMDGPSNNTITRNRVTAIANSTEPTGTKKQQINLKGFMRNDVSATNSVDVRAPIFYDSDNTGYYVDPNGSSRFTRLVLNSSDNLSWGAVYGAGVPTISGSTATGLYFYPTGSTNGATFTMLGSYAIATGSMRAPIFYDSANTAYYVDPASTSVLATMRATTTEHVAGDGNGIRFWLSDVYKIYMSGTANGTWGGRVSGETTSDYNMYFRMSGGTNRGFVFRSDTTNVAGIDASGNGRFNSVAAVVDVRAPIFYDSNNTGYYVDPAGDTNLNKTFTYLGGRDTNGNWNTGFQNTPPASYNFHGDISSGGPSGTWWFYESMRHSNASNYWGTQIAWGWEDNSNRLMQRNVSGNSFSAWVEYLNTSGRTYSGGLEMTGIIQSTADIRAPLYYDRNDTSYYVNPNGESVINTLTVFGELNLSAGTTYVDHSGTIVFRNQANYVNSATLTTGGDFTASGNVTAYSDARIKDNIETIPNALDKLDLIRGVTYTRTDRDDKERRYAGVIAQEIEKVLPEAIFENEEYKSVDYNATIALLIQAVKELRDEVEALRK